MGETIPSSIPLLLSILYHCSLFSFMVDLYVNPVFSRHFGSKTRKSYSKVSSIECRFGVLQCIVQTSCRHPWESRVNSPATILWMWLRWVMNSETVSHVRIVIIPTVSLCYGTGSSGSHSVHLPQCVSTHHTYVSHFLHLAVENIDVLCHACESSHKHKDIHPPTLKSNTEWS